MSTNRIGTRLTAAVALTAAIALGGGGLALADPGTLYVDDDDPACGGKAPCYSTIQGAIDDASSGDTIIVAAGVYGESLVVGKSVTLLGARADIDPHLWCGGSNATLVTGGPDVAGITITASDVAVNGFDVSLFDHYGIYVGNGGDPPGATVIARNIDIAYNRVHDNGKYGLQLIALGENVSVSDVVVRNNYFHSNGRNGMKLVDVTDCVIDSNLISDNGFGPEATKPEYRFGVFLEDERYNGPIYRPCIRNTFVGNSFVGNASGAINMEVMGQAVGAYWSSTAFLEGTVVLENDFHGDSSTWGLKVDDDYKDDGTQNGFGPIATVDAIDNWWGHDTGPLHGTNPAGQGTAVSDDVDFDPWSQAAIQPTLYPPACVLLDVRPRNTSNQINTGAKMLVPIAILGAQDFDPAVEVEIESVVIHGASPSPTRFDTEDVNGDGIVDLTLYFRARDFRKPDPETECGNPQATVEIEQGTTTTGEPLGGWDYVTWLGPDCG